MAPNRARNLEHFLLRQRARGEEKNDEEQEEKEGRTQRYRASRRNPFLERKPMGEERGKRKGVGV